jgi:hypothetical protein
MTRPGEGEGRGGVRRRALTPRRLLPRHNRGRTAHAPKHPAPAPLQPTFTTPQPGKTRPRRLALAALLATTALLLTAAPALAAPGIHRAYGEPYVEVEEFPPGATAVSADFYAFVTGSSAAPAAARFQYVDAAGYEPNAPEPYAAGTTVTLASEITLENPGRELHLHLSLAPETTYYWRLLASDSEGTTAVEETIDTHAPSRSALPDARAYEQVSPPDKNDVDALGNGRYMNMWASPSGSAFAYFSFLPFPGAPANGAFFTEYLSARSSPPAWSTQGLQVPLEPTAFHDDEVLGFTPDLSRAIVLAKDSILAPADGYAFLRDSATGTFQLLLPHDFGEGGLLFPAASADGSRLLLETEEQLLFAAQPGVTNLYEWDESRPQAERVRLAGLIPTSGQPSCGPSGPACLTPLHGSTAAPGGGERLSSARRLYSRDLGAISADGSRVFFCAEGRIYERLPEAEETLAVSPGPATFLAATPDGRYVFYSEAGELYRFDTETATRQPLTAGAEGVLGALGVSADGSYAYFLAPGVLAANQGPGGETAQSGADNLYRWHQGAVSFIARLLPTELKGDESDWFASSHIASAEGRTSRVDPAGTALLFTSKAPLTGYGPSTCAEEANVQVPCTELFLYDAAAAGGEGALACLSCNPSGAPARFPARLGSGNTQVALGGPAWSPHLTRNLSVDGSRAFFETEEALLPADRDNATDVYEWERPGAGSCSESSPSYFTDRAGCLFLVSTGTAHAPSYFGDASASGEDAFFFTRQPLVGQDRDLNYDVYDARVNGGIASQNPPTSAPPCEAEAACKPHPTETPSSPTGASGAFHGPEEGPNHPQRPPCRSGFVRKHGHCVKKMRRRHHRRSHRRANPGRRGSR